jgi:hypothetical protein
MENVPPKNATSGVFSGDVVRNPEIVERIVSADGNGSVWPVMLLWSQKRHW